MREKGRIFTLSYVQTGPKPRHQHQLRNGLLPLLLLVVRAAAGLTAGVALFAV